MKSINISEIGRLQKKFPIQELHDSHDEAKWQERYNQLSMEKGF